MANEIERLGRFVSERRKELGLSQIELWQAGGPSNSTLTGIETGTATTVSPLTLRKLDEGLEWAYGSAYDVLNGGEPHPRVDVHPDATPEIDVKTEPVPPEMMLELMLVTASMLRTANEVEKGAATEKELIEAVRSATKVIMSMVTANFGGPQGMQDLSEALGYLGKEGVKINLNRRPSGGQPHENLPAEESLKRYGRSDEELGIKRRPRSKGK